MRIANKAKAKAVVHKKGNALPVNNPLLAWRWYGWNDFKMGLGYRKEYETADRHFQLNYEMGRCYAATIKQAWGVVPDWTARQTFMEVIDEALDDKETMDAFSAEHDFYFKDTK